LRLVTATAPAPRWGRGLAGVISVQALVAVSSRQTAPPSTFDGPMPLE
jgi:hypothetical protein